MATHTGGCLCGAIRYEITGEPVRVANCHCDECRRATGASFATVAFFSEEDVQVVRGTPKQFGHAADSGNTMTKEFCGDCGSQLLGAGSGSPGVRSVRVGSLDDAGFVVPQMDLYTGKALPFTRLSDATEHFVAGRPRHGR
tara:strand:- start:3328 stop:3750 length:423 start_codon:yes stop_codon:yes gene_type:complete